MSAMLFSPLISAALLLTIIPHCHSQTNMASFGITTASSPSSGTKAIIILTLSWNKNQHKCVINSTNGLTADTSFGCSTYAKPYATLITDALANNEYEMKIEMFGHTSDSLKLDTIIVIDSDKNFYAIDHFCLPKPFRNTAALSLNIEALHCCHWSQRQKYAQFSMGGDTKLTVAYVQFRSDILSHKNEANEGALKPPKISQIGLSTLSSNNSGSHSEFDLRLHWDTAEYVWEGLVPSAKAQTYAHMFSAVSADRSECQFLSGFNLEISANVYGDSLGIDSLIVVDESGHRFTVDTFCNTASISEDLKTGETNTKCEWNENVIGDVYAFEGFLYNGNGSVYFLWTDSLFENVNQRQQVSVTSDYIQLQWLHSFTCMDTVSPYSKVTIYRDYLENAVQTGWLFGGDHRATVAAINCPKGPLNNCSRIAGGAYMQYTLDISAFINVIVQYELVLSSMPSGKKCALYYRFDSEAFAVGQSVQSTDTHPILYHNQTFTAPEYLANAYTTLSIRFTNDAAEDTNFCWFDNIYFFGDYLIEFDNCETVTSAWTLSTAVFSVEANCPHSTCLYLQTSTAYALKQYSNVEFYSNLALAIDIFSGSQLIVYYAYETQEFEVLSPNVSSSTKQIYDIPSANICATVLNIKFMTQSSASYVDNIRLSGTVLKTMSPTLSPTNNPSPAPTSPTLDPTFDPTLEPTTPAPTTEPTTHIPTMALEAGSDNSSSTVTIVCVVIIIFIAMTGTFVFVWWYRKRKAKGGPGALGQPLLDTDVINMSEDNDSDNDGPRIKSSVELNQKSVAKSYDINNVGHPINNVPGASLSSSKKGQKQVIIGFGEGGSIGGETQKDEFSSSSDSEYGLAVQFQKNVENDKYGVSDKGSVISDDMKEPEIIGAIHETPQ